MHLASRSVSLGQSTALLCYSEHGTSAAQQMAASAISTKWNTSSALELNAQSATWDRCETASDFDVSWFPPEKNNWQSSVILTLHSGYLMIFEDAQNALNNQPRHVMVVMDDMNLSPNEFTTVHHQTTQPSYAKLHNQDQPGDFLTTQRVVKNRRWLFTRRSSRTSWFFNWTKSCAHR